MRRPLRPSRQGQRGLTPGLWPLWPTLFVAVIAALLAAAGVYVLLSILLGLEPIRPAGGADPAKALIEVAKVSLGVAAGVGAVVALVVAYRRNRLDEAESYRGEERLFNDRYQTAAEQLGHDKPAVRLAGVYAMARLADAWEDERQPCIDVLCAYLRMTVTSRESADAEVRDTIVRVIRGHLSADGRHTWKGRDFDLTGAVFENGCDFSGAVFSAGTLNLQGVTFSGGKADFSSAEFCGGQVTFRGAEFSGGTVSFRDAVFSGGIIGFWEANFSGSTLSFRQATFSGAVISFREARFLAGQVVFPGARLSSGQIGFYDAEFLKGTLDFGGSSRSRVSVAR